MQHEHDFLKGGGEMGQRMRDFDWGNTPVGTPDRWPMSLRAMVSTLLHSKFPMFLLWGDDYLQFYNDAYVPSFGTDGKHPKALGQFGAECWAEAWSLLGPMLDQVRLGGEAVWKEDQPVPIFRNGRIENTYWTFSYSPVLDDLGNIGGVLSTCVETTDKVESLEKLQENKNELAFAIEAAELGTWDLNPHTGRFVANARLKQWFGLRPDDEIPLQTAIDNMAPEDRERVSEEIARTLDPARGGKYETTYTIIHPYTLKRRIVLAKGKAWFDEGGSAYRFNGTLQDITRDAESRAQLFTSFEEAPVAIATIDQHELTFTMANKFYCELVGRTQSDIVGKPLLTALPEIAGQGFDRLLEEVIATGVPFISKEISVDLVRNGALETRFVDLVYQPQTDARHRISGVLVVATDVTEQVLSRRTIEESESKFRSLVAEAPVATCLFVGRDQVIEIANDIMLGYWGKTRNVIGLPLAKAIPELIGQPFLQILDDVFTSGVAYADHAAEAQLMVNGKLDTYYFDFTYKPIRNMFGEVYGIMDMAVDVTKEVLARKQIEAAEASLRNAIDLAELATWRVDFVHKKVYYSDRMQQWLGVDQAELEIAASPRVHVADRERIGQAVVEACDPKGDGVFNEVYRILNVQSNTERIIHSSGRTEFDPSGNPISMSGTAQDVTLQQELQMALEDEVRQRTEELENSNEDLRRSNDELSQYAYVASHDLQEPLRKIRIFAGMLAGRETHSPQGAGYVDKISQSAERMSLLIKDLLEFSRVSGSDRALVPVDLNGVVHQVLNDFELAISEKSASVQVADLPTIQAIPLQMNQLFYNLVGNALKFIDPERPPQIAISARKADDAEVAHHIRKPLPHTTYWRISITDNGIGFDPAYADQIFEVFKRLNAREAYPGSGIGLALCRRIVGKHGGHLFTDSVPGKGSTFLFLLPE